jgi:Protein of unknown function (DUF3048) C-terminal domain/Protein of unknown function (DUF3048) N-terminal domain
VPHGQLRPVHWAGNGLVIVAGLAAVACGAVPNPVQSGTATPAASPKATIAAKTDRASGPAAPLTGLPAGSAADAARPAVAVVVGAGARGLGSADVVFQEFAAPVRYIAVFQSRRASGVGPVTSTQPTDSEVLSVLHPLIAYDGGTPTFIKILDRSEATDVGFGNHPGAYATTSSGVATSTGAVLRAARGSGPPPPIFVFPGGVTGAGPLATTGLSHPASIRVSIPGNGTQVWTFDSHTGRWALSSGGPRVAVANLVVQTVPYRHLVNRKSGTTLQSARVLGGGLAEVFSGSPGGSAAAAGTWSKPHFQDVTNYFDKNGNPMAFQPGPTWVILAPRGTRVAVSGGH